MYTASESLSLFCSVALPEEVSGEGGLQGRPEGLDAEPRDDSPRHSTQQLRGRSTAGAHHQPVPREGGGEGRLHQCHEVSERSRSHNNLSL